MSVQHEAQFDQMRLWCQRRKIYGIYGNPNRNISQSGPNKSCHGDASPK